MGWSCRVLREEFVLVSEGGKLYIIQMFLCFLQPRTHAVMLSVSKPSAGPARLRAELRRLFHPSGFLLGYIQCLLRGVRLHLYLEQDQEAIHHTNTATITGLAKC